MTVRRRKPVEGDAARNEGVKSDIRGWTAMFRSSDPYWTPIRAELELRRINTRRAVLAKHLPDGPCREFGVVVTPGGKVFEFDYEWPSGRREQGLISLWTDITDCWLDTAAHLNIELAFDVLSERTRSRPSVGG